MNKGQCMPYSRHKYIYKLSPSIHLGGLFYLRSLWISLMRVETSLRTNFKFNKMKRLIYFLIGGLCMIIAIGLSSGQLQEFIKFNSVDSEIMLFMMSITFSILFLKFSIYEKEN